MAVIVMPSGLRIGKPFGIQQRRYDMAEVSDTTGDSAVRLFGPPRWAVSIVSPEHLSLDDAAQWESLKLRLRGGVNVLALWDVVRPQPRGTARGALALSAPAAAGATSMAITGAQPAAGTLLTGDWLQVGSGLGTSQLVKLVSSTTLAGGAGVVSFEPPLRRGYAAGSTVVWDKPLGFFRQPPAAAGASWEYVSRRHVRGFAFDGIEVFA